MRHRLRTRPRLAAAVSLALAGGLLVAGSGVPAQAECLSYSAAVYKNKDGRHYIGEEENCVTDTQWDQGLHLGDFVDNDVSWLPEGVPTGGGAMVHVPMP